jgi:hypothetical protein
MPFNTGRGGIQFGIGGSRGGGGLMFPGHQQQSFHSPGMGGPPGGSLSSPGGALSQVSHGGGGPAEEHGGGVRGNLGGLVGWGDMRPEHRAALVLNALSAGAGIYSQRQEGKQRDRDREEERRRYEEEQRLAEERAQGRLSAIQPFVQGTMGQGPRQYEDY